MFGFSISKILLLVLVILGVLYGARLLRQLTGGQGQPKARGGQKHPEPRAEAQHRGQLDDVVECEKCGVYVATWAGDCGKVGCPFKKG